MSNTSSSSPPPSPSSPTSSSTARQWRDVFWLCMFVLHIIILSYFLGSLGSYGYYGSHYFTTHRDKSTTYWPLYGMAAGVGTALALGCLTVMGSWARAGETAMTVSVHILTTYLAVISVFCFWGDVFFWGVAFAVGAALHFVYVMSVLDR